MKINFDDNKIIIYLFKNNIKKEDFNDLKYIEEYFRNIFIRLKQIYNIEINGFYNINVYIDNIFGIVLELIEENIEYIDYYDDVIDMKLELHENEFLYHINDVTNIDESNIIYKYNNKYYLKIKNKNELYKILEYTSVVYKDTDIILKHAKKYERS